jgi:hypothetical protein
MSGRLDTVRTFSGPESGAGKPRYYGSGYGNPIFVEKSHRKKPANLSNEASTTIDG